MSTKRRSQHHKISINVVEDKKWQCTIKQLSFNGIGIISNMHIRKINQMTVMNILANAYHLILVWAILLLWTTKIMKFYKNANVNDSAYRSCVVWRSSHTYAKERSMLVYYIMLNIWGHIVANYFTQFMIHSIYIFFNSSSIILYWPYDENICTSV